VWLMWGLVSFFILIIVALYSKWFVSWTPDETGIKKSCQYKEIENKNGIVSVLLGVEGMHGYRFSLKRESPLHGFGKWCGLAREFQTGDEKFDHLVYILSDNHLLHRRLAASHEIRSAISTIFNYGVGHLAEVKELICAEGKLWIVLKVGTSYGPGTINTIAEALVPKLNIIKQEVNSISPRNIAFWRDPVFLKAIVMFSISFGLATNGFIHLFRIYYISIPFLVTTDQIIKMAVILGIGICALLIILSLFFIGRTARTHLVVFELATFGLFGAIATCYVELYDFNIETDLSRPVMVITDVQQKYTQKGRKSGTKYYVVLRDWRCGCGSLTKKVPYDIYQQLHVNGKADVLLHQGALGYEWVSGISDHGEN